VVGEHTSTWYQGASGGSRIGFRLTGIRAQLSGFGIGFRGTGFRVQSSGFKVQGSEFRVQGSGFRVQGSGCGVLFQGIGRTPPPRTTRTEMFRVSRCRDQG